MWTLILTVIMMGPSGGAAIHHIDFTTKTGCERAKSEWNSAYSHYSNTQAFAVCVEHD